MKKRIIIFIAALIFIIPLFNINSIEVKAKDVDKTANYRVVTEEMQDNKVKVMIDVDRFQDVYGAQVYLTYNKDALKFDEVMGGNVIVEDTNSKLLYNGLDGENDVCYSITNVGKTIKSKTSGTLFSAIFTKKSSGDFGIKVLDKSILSDKNGETIKMKEEKNINIGDLEITKISDDDCFKLGSDAKVTVRVKNNGKAAKNGTLLVALYDVESKGFVCYNAGYQKILPGQSVELTGMMSIPKAGNYKLKAMVWDTIYSMNPLSKVIEIPVK
ncbi:hypothetical protein ACFIJ5_03565 [Haloimpatiens sp. FM7330]|uniref:cohesin domain-containing protein n=1 Tax=Haloimpatiens sp. FM7330 TaxID=3298610 RepID=UPI003630D3DE